MCRLSAGLLFFVAISISPHNLRFQTAVAMPPDRCVRLETAGSRLVAPWHSSLCSIPCTMNSCLRLRGGISKYYNHTAPPNRGGIFEDPAAGVPEGEGQSVWNKGGWTWEEKDMTTFCRALMTHELQSFSTPPDPIRFVNVTWVKGHAVVTYRQGKKIAGVNWDELTVRWELTEAAPSAWREKGVNGTMKLRDFYSDFAEDMECEVTVWGSRLAPAEHSAVSRAVLGFRDKFVLLPAQLQEAMLRHKPSSPALPALDTPSNPSAP